MAYIRSHETKQRARGKTVKTYAVVYRAKVRTDDGRVVSRLRQETHATKAAAEARVAELNAHRHESHHRPGRTTQAGSTEPRRLVGRLAGIAAGEGRQRPTQSAHARRVRPIVGPLRVAGPGPRADCRGDTGSAGALIGELATAGKRRGGGDLHPKTVKHAWHVMRQVFRYALRHDALAANPVDRVDFSPNRATGDRERFEPHPLTAEQIADVCAALRGERPGRDGKPLPVFRRMR